MPRPGTWSARLLTGLGPREVGDMTKLRVVLVQVVVAAGLAVGGPWGATPAASAGPVWSLESAGAALGQVVNTQPAAWTPQVRDGSVWAITQTGTTMVVGGEFTKVRAAKGGADLYSRQHDVARE